MEDNLLFSISIEQLLHRKIGKGFGKYILATSNIEEYIDLFTFPLRVDAFVFLACVKGSVNFSINLKEWNVSENMYLISLPENVIGVNSISDDFQGYIFLMSMEYLQSITIDLKDILPYYVYVRSQPCFNVVRSKIKNVIQYYDLLSTLLEDENSKRKEDIIKGLITSFIHKLAQELDEFEIKSNSVKSKSKEYYYMKFMGLLLENFREQHTVGFYSEKLALTPKYLSSLMKEVSGMSASQWINNYIVVEAKTLLKFSDKNIMQIADYLYFPNQSFFSKYIKQHTGLTPKQYREK